MAAAVLGLGIIIGCICGLVVPSAAATGNDPLTILSGQTTVKYTGQPQTVVTALDKSQGPVYFQISRDPQTPLYAAADLGYTQVDYVDFEGKNFIDTGVDATQSTKLTTDLQWTTSMGKRQLNGYYFNTGSYWGVNAADKLECYQATTYMVSGSREKYVQTYTYGDRIVLTRDDTTILSRPCDDVNEQRTYFLGNLDDNGKPNGYYCYYKLYYFQAERASCAVRSMVPARSNADNTYGLFDQVNAVFYRGNFTTVGAPVSADNQYWVAPWQNDVDSTANQMVLAEDTTYYVHYYTVGSNGLPSAIKTQSFHVNACEHDYQGVVTTEPTCTEPGERLFTCTICGDNYTETIPHREHDYQVTVTAPTCVEAGYTTHQCQYCADKYVDEPVPATSEHTYVEGDWQITTPATCTRDGVESQNCMVCKRLATRAIPATGHDWTGEPDVTEPDCTHDGNSVLHCQHGCGETQIKVLPMLGHDWGEWEIDQAATCTVAGEQHHQCTRCHETETAIISATGHQYDEWTTNADGTAEEHTCTICGTTETRSLVTGTTGGDNSGTVWLIFGIIAGGVLVLGGGAVSWLFIAGRQKKVATA